MSTKWGHRLQIHILEMKASIQMSESMCVQYKCTTVIVAKTCHYLDGNEYDVHTYPDESCGPQNEKGIHCTNNH